MRTQSSNWLALFNWMNVFLRLDLTVKYMGPYTAVVWRPSVMKRLGWPSIVATPFLMSRSFISYDRNHLRNITLRADLQLVCNRILRHLSLHASHRELQLPIVRIDTTTENQKALYLVLTWAGSGQCRTFKNLMPIDTHIQNMYLTHLFSSTISPFSVGLYIPHLLSVSKSTRIRLNSGNAHYWTSASMLTFENVMEEN